ncbi:MAG: hypothetical protein ACP5UQ_15570, partial [Anaerolineae bacterium]
MDTREKLNLLGQAARYDDYTALGSDAVVEGRGLFAADAAAPAGRDLFPCISHVTTPRGERKPILKV